MVLTSTRNGFDGKIESTHRAALVLEEPMTQYGWARLGIESINLHKRGWRSHPLPVLLILSIPMAWAARCVLSTRVQKAHTHTPLEEWYKYYSSPLYISNANYHCCYRVQPYGVTDTRKKAIFASMVASGFARPFPTVDWEALHVQVTRKLARAPPLNAP